MRDLVDLVEALGLEEEVPGLAADHRHRPGQQGGPGRVHRQQPVGHQKADGAEQVQALVDAAVVVVAVVVPALDPQLFKESIHGARCSWLLQGLKVGTEHIGHSTQAWGHTVDRIGEERMTVAFH